MKQTRNRAKKPVTPLGLATLESWQSDSSNVQWAQEDDRFRLAVTVLINERQRAFDYQPGETENCRLGRVQGYEKALSIVKELAMGPIPPPRGMGDPDYPNDDIKPEPVHD